jgi:hypothetical protein
MSMSLNDTEMRGPSDGNANQFQDRMGSQFSAAGNQFYDFARHWIAVGNARRFVVRHNNQDLVQLPLTVAVVATILAPQLVAIGIIAAILSSCSIEVRHE